jgi:hypothetical protein
MHVAAPCVRMDGGDTVVHEETGRSVIHEENGPCRGPRGGPW